MAEEKAKIAVSPFFSFPTNYHRTAGLKTKSLFARALVQQIIGRVF